MEVKLLSINYKDNKEQLYKDFVDNRIDENAEYFSEKSVFVESIPSFPIYLAKAHNNLDNFLEAIVKLKKYYIDTDREVHLNKYFWYSLFVLYHRDDIVKKYPEVLENQKIFENIVLKKFDWENYVYKCILAAEYISDASFESEEQEYHFITVIYNNLDLFNYIIKYNIFRNSRFIVNFLSIIDEEGLSSQLKKKIKHRSDLGKDERYGRRVIFELNKNYPIIMAPFLEKDELKNEILEALSLYLEDSE